MGEGVISADSSTGLVRHRISSGKSGTLMRIWARSGMRWSKQTRAHQAEGTMNSTPTSAWSLATISSAFSTKMRESNGQSWSH